MAGKSEELSTPTNTSNYHGRILDKLCSLKDRGIFQCKLPDILVGHMLARMDRTDPDKPVFMLGGLEQHDLGSSIEARWYVCYDHQGGLLTHQGDMLVEPYTELICKALDMYNSVLDDLMGIADNGSLT